jgi:hypothetical protein
MNTDCVQSLILLSFKIFTVAQIRSRRSPRIVYLGFACHFVSATKNAKDTQLKFEE